MSVESQLVKTLNTEDQNRRPPCKVDDVAQLAGKLYVLCSAHGHVKVFGQEYDRLSDIFISGSSAARTIHTTQIALCKESHTIYVAGPSFVGRVASTGTGSVEELLGPQVGTNLSNVLCLTITSRRLLVVAVFQREPNSRTASLVQYLPNERQWNQIFLPYDMVPALAVETKNGTFVVSHAESQQRRSYTLSEVDIDGHVIRVCGEQLHEPRHLALNDDGRVIVADWGKHRVLLLDKQLQLERVLLDKEHNGLNLPYRLCLVPETGCLVVVNTADVGHQRQIQQTAVVKVFRVF